MTYLDSRMTDAELIRASSVADSPMVRTLSDRLRVRTGQMKQARDTLDRDSVDAFERISEALDLLKTD